MASVKKNSIVRISRTVGGGGGQTTTLENGEFFNGYIYNMSLAIGYNGEPTNLTLNLALNQLLKDTKTNETVSQERKRDIRRVKSLVQNQKKVPVNYVGNLGNAGAGSYLGAQNRIATFSDKDFNINPNFLGVNCSYDIVIYDAPVIDSDQPIESYAFKNFKITSFSINKKDNQKILTLNLVDNSFVFDKIYVALLGQEVAIDDRSINPALVKNLKINCPPVGTVCNAREKIAQIQQNLHFSNKKFANEFVNNLGISNDKNYSDIDVVSAVNENYVLVKSSDTNKSIYNGFGGVIILGEEDYRDAPCASAETSYTFNTLLKAMRAFGITINGIVDKSNGQLRKSYTGTLKQVLNQWCQDFAYTYAVDFQKSNRSNLVLQGIDLSSSFSKEELLQSKLELEDLEASQTSETNFVIKSSDLSYDLSKQELRLYSSFYYKESKDKEISLQKDRGARVLQNIQINSNDIFGHIFGSGMRFRTKRDFSGSFRSFNEVLTSAILGKFSPALRGIYNYQIGAYEALGFIPVNADSLKSSVNLPSDNDAIFSEAIAQVAGLTAETLNTAEGTPSFNFNLGFRNAELEESVIAMENYIADFVGRYYWTAPETLEEGEIGNETFYIKHEVTSNAPVVKMPLAELYNLDVFRNGRYLLDRIKQVYTTGETGAYYEAYTSLTRRAANINNICRLANDSFDNLQGSKVDYRKYVFFYERSSASYSIYQELLDDLLKLKVTVDANTSAAPIDIDLAKLYQPTARDLSPVSLAALQSVLPISTQNISFGSFQFSVLIGYNRNTQIFRFRRPFGGVNVVEMQNNILSRCQEILNTNSTGRESSVLKNLQSCSNTILYQTCIKECEEADELLGIDDQIKFASGAPAVNCKTFQVYRLNWKIDLRFLKNSIARWSVDTSNNINLLPLLNDFNFYVQTARSQSSTLFSGLGTFQYESIVAPSEQNLYVRLISNTTQKYFLPYRNHVLGGIEDRDDLLSIVNNEGFSLGIDLNNITPNLRELYSDESNPSFVSAPVTIRQGGNDPAYVQYQGYEQNDPKYEFTTFSQYHQALRNVYDSRNRSVAEPSLNYTADIFCNKMSVGNSALKNLLSIDKGLSSLNINFSQQGLNLTCSFESSPAVLESLEAIILRNRPNIKLINTNYAQ